MRITVYVLRFLTTRFPCKNIGPFKQQGRIEPEKIAKAKVYLIRREQTLAFQEKRLRLASRKKLPRNSSLLSLHPHLDDEGLIRVGGRLSNLPIPYNEKHPPILPKTSPLSRLYVIFAHQVTFHSGTLLTYAYLQRQV